MKWGELQTGEAIEVIRRTITAWFQGTHYVNVLVRRNGKDEQREADWLKYIPDVIDRELATRDAALVALSAALEQLRVIPNHVDPPLFCWCGWREDLKRHSYVCQCARAALQEHAPAIAAARNAKGHHGNT